MLRLQKKKKQDGFPVLGCDTSSYCGDALDCGETPTPSPVASFVWQQLGDSLFVGFGDTSSGEIDSWLWEFGDDDSSVDQSPSHAYPEPGTYSVTLSVSGPAGSSSFSQDVTVN